MDRLVTFALRQRLLIILVCFASVGLLVLSCGDDDGGQPTLVVLTEGEIRIHRTEGGVASATVEGGFMSVEGDRVTIVTDAVEQPSGV